MGLTPEPSVGALTVGTALVGFGSSRSGSMHTQEAELTSKQIIGAATAEAVRGSAPCGPAHRVAGGVTEP